MSNYIVDCTEYSEQELSLVVMNDECLYNMRNKLTKPFLKGLGINFTHEQWEVLQADIRAENE